MQASDQPESPRTLLLCRRLLPGAFARSSWPSQAPQGVAPGRRSWWPFLLQTCLLLAPVSPAQAFNRVQMLLQPNPDRRAVIRFDHNNEGAMVTGLTIRSETLVATMPFSNWVIQYSLLDGKASVLAGTSERDEVGPFHTADALATPLSCPSGICQTSDGALLVADNRKRILRLLPGGPGQPTTVSEMASWERPGGQGGDLADTSFSVATMVECRDGSVLAGDVTTGKVLRFHEGRIDPFPGLTTQLGARPLLLNLPDGSILGTGIKCGLILRVGVDGTISRFAGPDLGPEQPRPEHTFDWTGFNIMGLCLGRDGSVLVTVMGNQRLSVVRIGDHGLSLVAGPQPAPALTEEPNYFEQVPKGTEALSAELADGTLVFIGWTGIALISPVDALQTTLEELVVRGRAALAQGKPAEWREVEQKLRQLCQPIEANLAALNREGRQGRLSLPDKPIAGSAQPPEAGPALYKDLVTHIAGFANHPMERLRARLALRELRALQKALP